MPKKKSPQSKRYTKTEKKKILAEIDAAKHDNSRSVQSVCDEHGVSPSTITYWRKAQKTTVESADVPSKRIESKKRTENFEDADVPQWRGQDVANILEAMIRQTVHAEMRLFFNSLQWMLKEPNSKQSESKSGQASPSTKRGQKTT